MPEPARTSRRTTAARRSTDSEREAAAQAERHRRIRSDHATEISEDYVEAIADLIASAGEARVVELARRLGVTHVTVTRTVARLQREGLVTTRPYRSIFLTEAGRRLAEDARRRHTVVFEFLRALGVDEKTAHADAEGIEHHVSKRTLAAFERFVSARAAR